MDQVFMSGKGKKVYLLYPSSKLQANLTDYIELGRRFESTIVIQHNWNNDRGKELLKNRSVPFVVDIKPSKSRWEGSFLAYAYRSEADREGDLADIREPIDLDMTAYGPIVSFMRWRAVHSEEHRLDPVGKVLRIITKDELANPVVKRVADRERDLSDKDE